MASPEKKRILTVANKKLPPNDYRVRYGVWSKLRGLEVVLALPGRPEGAPANTFVEMGLGEGIGLADPQHFAGLFAHMAGNRREYAVAHFFSTKLILLGPILARLAGVPCVITVTGFGRVFNSDELLHRALRIPYRVLFRFAASLSRAVLFQNRGDMRTARERMGIAERNSYWVGSGVEADVCESKDFESGPLKVLLVARLREDKGVRLFLETAERAVGEEMEFSLAGPSSKGGEGLYPRVLDADERGVLRYLGELGAADLDQVYRQHHVLLFPSYGEGMSRVMIEAAFARLCPVASDIAANRDLVEDGRSGFLVDVKSPGAVERFCGHLARLARDRSLAKAMAQAYQGDTVSRFSVSAYASRMDALLRELGLVK